MPTTGMAWLFPIWDDFQTQASRQIFLLLQTSHTEKLARNPPGNVSRKPQSEHAQIQIHHYLHQNFASDTSDPNCCLGSLPRESVWSMLSNLWLCPVSLTDVIGFPCLWLLPCTSSGYILSNPVIKVQEISCWDHCWDAFSIYGVKSHLACPQDNWQVYWVDNHIQFSNQLCYEPWSFLA